MASLDKKTLFSNTFLCLQTIDGTFMDLVESIYIKLCETVLFLATVVIGLNISPFLPAQMTNKILVCIEFLEGIIYNFIFQFWQQKRMFLS